MTEDQIQNPDDKQPMLGKEMNRRLRRTAAAARGGIIGGGAVTLGLMDIVEDAMRPVLHVLGQGQLGANEREVAAFLITDVVCTITCAVMGYRYELGREDLEDNQEQLKKYDPETTKSPYHKYLDTAKASKFAPSPEAAEEMLQGPYRKEALRNNIKMLANTTLGGAVGASAGHNLFTQDILDIVTQMASHVPSDEREQIIHAVMTLVLATVGGTWGYLFAHQESELALTQADIKHASRYGKPAKSHVDVVDQPSMNPDMSR